VLRHCRQSLSRRARTRARRSGSVQGTPGRPWVAAAVDPRLSPRAPRGLVGAQPHQAASGWGLALVRPSGTGSCSFPPARPVLAVRRPFNEGPVPSSNLPGCVRTSAALSSLNPSRSETAYRVFFLRQAGQARRGFVWASLPVRQRNHFPHGPAPTVAPQAKHANKNHTGQPSTRSRGARRAVIEPAPPIALLAWRVHRAGPFGRPTPNLLTRRPCLESRFAKRGGLFLAAHPSGSAAVQATANRSGRPSAGEV